jgi:predicted TIM-barrel fold metal-dependent hydrolase
VLIVDAQVHIWNAGKPTNANHRQVPAFTAPELLKEMDEAGVHAALIHPPASWDPNSNELAVEAARAHPQRLAILGNFPLDRPESRALIDGWKQRPGMLGLRFVFLQPHQRTWPTDGTIDWLWPAAERAGVPLMVLVPGMLDHLDRIAGKHPELKLTIDHVGLNLRGKGARVFEDLPAVCALAKHPNVAVKASGMPSLSQEKYPFRDLHPHIKALVDAFGPKRVFWGTDLTRMPCTYYECIHLFTEHLPWLKGEDLDDVMGRGVCEWLGWPLAKAR